jgi:ABC-type transport system substrate-binding protein
MRATGNDEEEHGVRAGGKTAPVLALAAVVLAAVLVGCSNTPPPPVVSTPVAATTPSPAPSPSQIVIGVDDIVGGYNPHDIADVSTVTTALSELLLPSVFRPDDKGDPRLDTNLMKSATVVSQQPFKVAYEIRADASWSDGPPIAAEDFDYLYQAMKTQPGVVDPAGYRLITDVQSREGGKRVEVTFGKPYPAWQTLFSNLLPSHLLKDAPGGWGGALAGSFPAVGGPFAVKTVDNDRGEIVLQHNDRYWEKPPAIDSLVLQRADQQSMANALRSDNDQFVMARTDATGLKLLGDLGQAVKLHTVPQPLVASVLLRPAGTVLADDQVREAVAALIDRSKPTLPATGAPGTPDAAKAEQLLKAAGYVRDTGTWRKGTRPLSLVVASPGRQEPYASIAKELQSELVAAGIGVDMVNPAPRDLFGSRLAIPVRPGQTQPAADPNGQIGVDIAVVPQSVAGDATSILASNFGCAPGQSSQDRTQPVVPANPAAFCDDGIQPTIDSALTGAASATETLATLEPTLWGRDVDIPLFQLADTLAIGSGISGITPGPPMVGPFDSAVNWTRAPK